jgi:hypothetical protein
VVMGSQSLPTTRDKPGSHRWTKKQQCHVCVFTLPVLQALTPYEQQLAKLEAKYKKNNAKVGDALLQGGTNYRTCHASCTAQYSQVLTVCMCAEADKQAFLWFLCLCCSHCLAATATTAVDNMHAFHHVC